MKVKKEMACLSPVNHNQIMMDSMQKLISLMFFLLNNKEISDKGEGV
jgi:hypothetical protein